MLLMSASTGWSFRPVCGAAFNSDGTERPGTLMVKFRDQIGNRKYVAWYDSTLDREGKRVFAGGMQMHSISVFQDSQSTVSKAQFDTWIRQNWNYFIHPVDGLGPDGNSIQNLRLERQLPISYLPLLIALPRVPGACGYRPSMGQAPQQMALQRGVTALSAYALHGQQWPRHDCLGYYVSTSPSCVSGVSVYHTCRGEQAFSTKHKRYDIKIASGLGSDGQAHGMRLYFSQQKRHHDSLFFEIVTTVFTSVVLGALGWAIGVALGASGALLSAISAGFKTFITALIKGKDVLHAFLDALKSGALAYVGKLAYDRFGKMTGIVSVGSDECPSQQCWHVDLVGEIPEVAHLIIDHFHHHEAFITWSKQAYQAVGTSGWSVAVPIRDVAVPGCQGSGCTTAGLVIATPAELHATPQPTLQRTPLYRLNSRASTDHFYTINATERAQAIQIGFADGGAVGYVSPTQAPGTLPLYRSYRGKHATAHFYTTDKTQLERAVKQSGYKSEGVEGYVLAKQLPGTQPLYELQCLTTQCGASGTVDFKLVRGDSNRNRVISHGWSLVARLGYVWPTAN